jgi:hypothetical protein
MIQREHSSPDSFERILQTTEMDMDFFLSDMFAQVLCEFYLNPRYLRGSDFLMRFSQGRWAEDIVARTINATDELRAVPYGPSSVAPSEPREMELYFERLDKAGTIGKRPDLLILGRDDYEAIHPRLNAIGPGNLPFTPEADLDFLHSRAIIAVEVENSLWVAREMPDYGKGVPLTELAHPLGTMTRQPDMTARFVQDKNGHILPYVHFSGGQMALSEEILTELRSRL